MKRVAKILTSLLLTLTFLFPTLNVKAQSNLSTTSVRHGAVLPACNINTYWSVFIRTTDETAWKCTPVAGWQRIGPIVISIGWSFGDLATGAALTTSEIGYISVPDTCTIVGWHIMVDAGTATIQTARIAGGGTVLPTLGSNSISTSGVSISSGTKVDSTVVTDFTSTSLVVNDTLGFFLTSVSTVKQLTFQIDCKLQ